MGYQNFYATKLTNDIGAADTSIVVDQAPTATSGRLVLEARNPTQREIIKYTGVAGNTLTGVTRGQGGTTAKSHLKSSLVEMNATGEDLQDLYDAFAAFVGTYPLKGLYDNAIINAGCMVAERLTSPTISTSYQYGKVDRFAAKATGTVVSAGTIEQMVAPNVVSQGYALRLAGVTITGTGVVYVRYRMEARDAIRFKNKTASFGVTVRHDVGSNVNYTILINKPTVADNFASTTNVHTSSATVVGTATNTQIKAQNVSLGDVSNGIEIEIQAACGAVTTKNFEFGEFIFNQGAVISTFMPQQYETDLAACQRYFLKAWTGVGYTGHDAVFVSSNTCWAKVKTPVPMRTTPTMASTSIITRYGGADYGWTSPSVHAWDTNGISITGGTTGTTNGNSGTLTSNGGTLTFDAEL